MPSTARPRSSSRGRSRRYSERTPLLRRITERNEDASGIEDADLLAAEVAQQGQGGAPQFPSKGRRYSHGQLVPAEDGYRDERKEIWSNFKRMDCLRASASGILDVSLAASSWGILYVQPCCGVTSMRRSGPLELLTEFPAVDS
jgi:hypothetical protein